jgi:NHL repeat
MRGRQVDGRSGLGACAKIAARLACTVAIFACLAAPAQAAPGDIFTFAGTGAAGFGGDGGPATSAALQQPISVAWLGDGSVLVADFGNHRIRRISPAGQITTVAGTGAAGYSGDGGAATSARLSWPIDVEPTADGGFLIADLGNKRVRKVSAAGVITTVAGTGQGGSQGDGGPATSARLGSSTGVAATADGGFLIQARRRRVLRPVAARPGPLRR